MEESKKDELIKAVSSLLEKHRDALSTDEIQAFETTLEVLRRLDDSEPRDYGKILEPIALNMLKFFTKPEILGQLIEWLNS